MDNKNTLTNSEEETKEINNISEVESIVNEQSLQNVQQATNMQSSICEPSIQNMQQTLNEQSNMSEQSSTDVNINASETENVELSSTENSIENNTNIIIEENSDSLQIDELSNEEKSPKKKKLIIIGSLATAMVAIVAIAVIALSGKDNSMQSTKEKNTGSTKKYSAYATALKDALENDTLVEEINKALDANYINVDSVELMSLDIDSDNEQELVAFAESGKERYLLHFEIDQNIYYENSYKMSTKTSLGYAYSIKDDKNLWYTEKDNTYTILGNTKLVIKEEDFLKDFFAITSEYDGKPFLSNAITYNLNKKLDVEKIEKTKIKATDILEDNDITMDRVREAAKEYAKRLEEEEQKRIKEEEEKQKAEEQAKKDSANTLNLNNNSIHYGKYLPTNGGDITVLTVNKDKTGTVNGNACTWSEEHKEMVSGEGEVPVIKFTCQEEEYTLTSFNHDTLSDGEYDLAYAE